MATLFRAVHDHQLPVGLDGIPVKCKSDECVPPKDVRDKPPYDGATVCPLASGDELLENFGLYTGVGALWADVGILAGFYAVFCILNYTALALLKFQSTGSSAAAKTEEVVEVEESSADEVRSGQCPGSIVVLIPLSSAHPRVICAGADCASRPQS